MENNDINNNINNDIKNDINKYLCKYCNKKLANRVSCWVHEKKCINNNNKINIITNNNITNNIINITNNIIIIKDICDVDVLKLTKSEIKNIFNKQLSCITQLIEYLYFNERLPENHKFCSTNLESKSLSIYNNDKDVIEKDRKKYIFDTVLDNSIEKLQILYNHYRLKFPYQKRKEIENIIKDMIEIKVNLFNNKLIQDTWMNRHNINKSDRQIYYSSSESSQSNDDNNIYKNKKINLDISDSD